MIEISSQPLGLEATRFTLRNSSGMVVELTDFGASIVAIHVPDRRGNLTDVTLGYDDLPGYADGRSYFGCTVGRYGNRIAKGRFQLSGNNHQLATNNGENHLHGGRRGFGQHRWSAHELRDGVAFSRLSPDGEEGYPGNLRVEVSMTLSEANELQITYRAVTDAPTYLNLTNHAYFNLAGHAAGSILDHWLWIDAGFLVPVNAGLIPEGDILDVTGTPFDFRRSGCIGQWINDPHEQLARGGGYDHCFVLGGEAGEMRHVATLSEPRSGRLMKVLTTEPGLQFYSGNFLDGTERGKSGAVYDYRGGLCLETQHFPDSPNQSRFPSTLLTPGQSCTTKTCYHFAAE